MNISGVCPPRNSRQFIAEAKLRYSSQGTRSFVRLRASISMPRGGVDCLVAHEGVRERRLR